METIVSEYYWFVKQWTGDITMAIISLMFSVYTQASPIFLVSCLGSRDWNTSDLTSLLSDYQGVTRPLSFLSGSGPRTSWMYSSWTSSLYIGQISTLTWNKLVLKYKSCVRYTAYSPSHRHSHNIRIHSIEFSETQLRLIVGHQVTGDLSCCCRAKTQLFKQWGNLIWKISVSVGDWLGWVELDKKYFNCNNAKVVTRNHQTSTYGIWAPHLETHQSWRCRQWPSLWRE